MAQFAIHYGKANITAVDFEFHHMAERVSAAQQNHSDKMRCHRGTDLEEKTEPQHTPAAGY